jgi:hypothetical protein
MYLDAADHAWQEWVVAYDLGHQVAVAVRFEAAMRNWSRPGPAAGRSWALLLANGVKTWGIAVLAVFLFLAGLIVWGPRYWRAWRRKALLRQIAQSGGSPSDAAVLYQRLLEILAGLGFEKSPSLTPIEFARRLPAEEGPKVVEFTEVYNSIRFGGDRSATSRLAGLLQDFESARKHRAVNHLATH